MSPKTSLCQTKQCKGVNVHYWRKADVAKLEIICEVADELHSAWKSVS